MNILCVDDEPLALEMITDLCQKLEGDNVIHAFDDTQDAIAYARDNRVHVAFLDINMPGMNGLELARELRKIYNNTNIIITTAYSEYSLDAFSTDCSGYLLKPISFESLQHQMEVLRFPIEDVDNTRNRVKITCFGNFEVYVDNVPVHFKYQMSKEILAYLVDRKGSLCSTSQISMLLWNDESHSEYYKKLRRDLLNTFKELGCDSIFNVFHGELGIIMDKVDCDYYNYISDPNTTTFNGEYMTQYSWAQVKM